MTLLRWRAWGIAKGQQIEGTVYLGQVLPGDVEIACCGIDRAMAEEELDGAQVYPGFQQMRGKAVPEGISTLLIIRR